MIKIADIKLPTETEGRIKKREWVNGHGWNHSLIKEKT